MGLGAPTDDFDWLLNKSSKVGNSVVFDFIAGFKNFCNNALISIPESSTISSSEGKIGNVLFSGPI